MPLTPAEQYRNAVESDRELWKLSQILVCMCCGVCPNWPPLAVHEIERRGQAPNRWGHPCNYLLVCQKCHSGPFATMPHAKQLAYKLIADPSCYDLRRWLRIRDDALLAPNRVTQNEVEAWAQIILASRVESATKRNRS